MAADLGEALKAPTKDPDWIKKIAIGGMVCWFWLLLPAAFGYFHDLIADVIDGEGEGTLPNWSGSHFVKGLGTGLVVAAYSLLACIPGAVVMLSYGTLVGYSIGASKGIMHGGSLFGNLFVGAAGLVALILVLGILAFVPMALVGFVEDGDIPAGFQVREIWARMQSVLPAYLRLTGLLLIPCVVAALMDRVPAGGYFRQIPAAIAGFYLCTAVLRGVARLYTSRVR